MALKNISLSVIACWVCYFYLLRWDWGWPRYPAWKGRTNFALPALSPYSSALIRNLDVDTLDTKKGQLQPEKSPAWAPPEPNGPYIAPFSPKPCLPGSSAFDWHVTFLSSWTEKSSSWRLSTSENVMSEFMLWLDLPRSLHFLPPGPKFILIIQWKFSSMGWLPAISHKPLIVLWTWVMAFYHLQR